MVLDYILKLGPDIELNNWRLSVLRNGDTIKTYDGSGTVPESFDWMLDSNIAAETLSKPLKFILSALDIKGQDAMAVEAPDIEVMTIESKRMNQLSDV